MAVARRSFWEGQVVVGSPPMVDNLEGNPAADVRRELAPDLVLGRVWQVTHELIETDETVLFDEAGSQLLVLNDTAAAIWYLIDGRRTLADIAQFLEAEGPPAPDALPSVRRFVVDLLARGAVTVEVDLKATVGVDQKESGDAADSGPG